jgi:pseudouridine-5'-phosphate glycosidase
VVLEPALISHGLPRPQNLNIAREAEDTVRAEADFVCGRTGPATPATLLHGIFQFPI